MTAPLPFPAKKYHRTDLGNAERFVTRHGQDVRWVPAWGKWIVWSGKRWAIDDTLEVHRLAKQTVRAMLEEAGRLEGSARKDLAIHAFSSEKESKLNAMLSRAKSEPGIAITAAQLDTEPWLLCAENGTIDLRTGHLREHRREDLITKYVPAPYDRDARCDRWERFLVEVTGNNRELIDFMQRAVGYSITGITSARVLFFLHGSGHNGKSKFLETLRALLSGYASQADFTTFLERKGDGPRNDIARLFSARLVTSSEVGEGKRLNESLLKTLTGDETITARFLHQEFFEFQPTFKLWLAANHRPIIRGTDNAIWDRIRLIPFTVEFTPEQRDKNLMDKLLAELPGILTWAVAGALLWQQHGLESPAVVVEASAEYRRDSDVLGAFVDDCCDVAPGHEVPATPLYRAYAQWCEENGEFKQTQTNFGKALAERGFPDIKRGIKYRIGLRLRADLPAFVARAVRHAVATDEQEALPV